MAFIASETLSHIPAIHNMEITRSFILGDAAIQDPDSDNDTDDKEKQTNLDEELLQTIYTSPYYMQNGIFQSRQEFPVDDNTSNLSAE